MPYARRASLALVLSLMPLNGCATTHSETLCLMVRSYSAEEQDAVADELEQLGPKSHVGQMMADYGRLRDEARAACR